MLNLDVFDGFIYVPYSFVLPSFREEIAQKLRDSLKPVVCIGYGFPGLNCIWHNDRKEFAKLVNHLIREHNCSDICCLTGPYGFNERETHISPSYLHNLYKKLFGISCMYDVPNSKLTYSRKLLMETKDTLQSIAERCGYDYSHFMRLFKKKYNITPTQFRKSIK